MPKKSDREAIKTLVDALKKERKEVDRKIKQEEERIEKERIKRENEDKKKGK